VGHVLLTNDFPPKVGGIQSYLWELWRRLPPERVTVVTGADPGAGAFDSAQDFRIERLAHRVVLPTAAVCRATRAIAESAGASLVVIDPALPLGLAGRSIGLPYAVVLHGAEVAAPARLPAAKALLQRVVGAAELTVAAGAYAAAEARRLAGADIPICEVPPGVDLRRFRPLSPAERRDTRTRAGLPIEGPVILAMSRLVPRKGIDVLICAAARLAPSRPDVVVAVAGAGRDRGRLERLAGSCGVPVWFLGAVPDEQLAPIIGCADVFAIPCRSRWAGLEQEGFGIVFLEAGACGVAQLAGSSGGAAEAVADGETGLVVERPDDVSAVEAALARLLDDGDLRAKMGEAARRRAEERFDYEHLAGILDQALAALE
jgi:phosphatidylinositol alpha-1,6-mannosyltransferase